MWHPRVNIPPAVPQHNTEAAEDGGGGWRKEDHLCVVSSRIWTLAVDTHVRDVKLGGGGGGGGGIDNGFPCLSLFWSAFKGQSNENYGNFLFT